MANNLGATRVAETCLQSVPTCPACGDARRTLLQGGLTDACFGAVGGEWTLWTCESCQSAYLDPRLDDAHLHLAYTDYYTHEESGSKRRSPSVRAYLKAALEGIYRAGRYRNNKGLLALATLMVADAQRQAVDYRHRYLPPAAPGVRLLDVGCGNGAFLDIAAAIGWQASGCDFDAAAVDAARAKGRDVRLGGIDSFPAKAVFDAVTMSHVIEHVAHPLQTLKSVRARLKPGGHLFVDTPNIASLGFAEFREHWRGLEVPRHLVLFNESSLNNLLLQAGFKDVEFHPMPSVATAVWRKSARIRAGLSPYAEVVAAGPTPPASDAISPAKCEYLTFTAQA